MTKALATGAGSRTGTNMWKIGGPPPAARAPAPGCALAGPGIRLQPMAARLAGVRRRVRPMPWPSGSPHRGAVGVHPGSVPHW